MGPNTKYCVLATVIFVMLVFVTFVVLVIFKPHARGPLVINRVTGNMTLLSVTVIFRHGARAPVEIVNNTIAAMFPNGQGEVTEVGIKDTFKLGQFLGDRYVKTGFLRSPPLPSEIHFRSRSNNRCLLCGALVGSGMWAIDENSEFTAVPIYAQAKNDKLLTHLQDCKVENKRINDRCGRRPPPYADWPAYEGFIYECIGLNEKNSDLFANAAAFSEVGGLVQMDRNGLPVPEWFVRNKKKIYELYEKVYSFIVGVGDYHDRNLLKMKQGYLLSRIKKDLWNQWDEYEKSGRQDWMVMALLHALGCGEAALGTSVPNFNALVIIELYEQANRPMIKVLYKDNSMAIPKDITHAVRSCSFVPCHLIEFSLSARRYVTDDPKAICNMKED